MSEQCLVVGLGNPGKEYKLTRHNIGFMVVEEISRQYHLRFSSSSKWNGLWAQGEVDDRRLVLLMPMTFMNNSGTVVKKMVNQNDVDLEHLLVVTDDVNLPFGQMRIRPRGQAGGHNGLTSVIEHLGTSDVARLRVGVGAPAEKNDMVNFVLSEFNNQEKKQLESCVQRAADCCVLWWREGIAQAMNQFNQKGQQ